MMSIEEIRYYLLRELPIKIKHSLHSLDDFLSSLSPYIYLVIIVLLFIIMLSVVRKFIAFYLSERKKRETIRKLSAAPSMKEYVAVLNQSFKESNPSIKNIGIYVKDQNVFKLLSFETFDSEIKDKSTFTETILTSFREYEKTGRYHVYTFAPANKNIAVRILSFDKLAFGKFKTDLEYLSTLLENFTEKDHLKTELLKTRVLNEVKDIFTSPAFNLENYFKFIGNIILKAGNLDGVKIISDDKIISIGQYYASDGQCRKLKVRNTDVNIDIYRKNGINQEDIVNIGRFLDLISAMLSFYSNKTLIHDFLFVLETAVRSFENTDTYYQRHSEKVEIVAVTIGEKLGLDEQLLGKLKLAARLHDIGMIGDIYDLTLKDLKLSEKDYGILKYHPLIGATITAPIDSLSPISDIILQHHEFNDGTGYPYGITSEHIITESKILSFSEIFVGLISDRPHRKGYTFEEATKQISDLVPHKIDSNIFTAFMDERDSILKKL